MGLEVREHAAAHAPQSQRPAARRRTSARSLVRCLARLGRDEHAQDLLEYALLTAAIGVASLVLFTTIASTMGDGYSNSTATQQELWEPCAPGVSCP